MPMFPGCQGCIHSNQTFPSMQTGKHICVYRKTKLPQCFFVCLFFFFFFVLAVFATMFVGALKASPPRIAKHIYPLTSRLDEMLSKVGGSGEGGVKPHLYLYPSLKLQCSHLSTK